MIVFKTLCWKNFLSTGNYKTSLDLTRHNNSLVSGENGAGKSTMLDALTFSLFGRSFRGINIPQLVNSINEKNCEVEIVFSVGNTEYKVIRGMKPKKFEIYKDGVLLDQDATAKDYQKILEEQILKMTFKSFCQVVILGSSNYVPFMQLSSADRRMVVENLLDIDVFSVMNTLVKSKLTAMKDQIRETEHNLVLTKSKAQEKHKLIKTLEKKSSDSIDDYKEEIQQSRNQIDDLDKQVEDYRKKIDDTMETLGEDITIAPKELIGLESEEKELKTKIKNIEKNKKFYTENDSCPTCTQDIQEHHKKNVLEEKLKEQTEIETSIDTLTSSIQETESRVNKVNIALSEVASLENKISEIQSKISVSLQYIDKMQRNIDSVQDEVDDVSDTKQELDQLIGEGKGYVQTRQELVEDQYSYSIASTLLKDSGIKSKIIKHYLPIMNRLINKYLTEMDFFCKFNLDENFSETIKSRHRDEFTYHSFSEGERLRIDLSLLLAWREIARIKNSLNCNLLILDEVFDSSLDGVGTEEFLKILTTFGNRANIFVISHKSDTMTDKFQNHIVFEKKNNFSRIK